MSTPGETLYGKGPAAAEQIQDPTETDTQKQRQKKRHKETPLQQQQQQQGAAERFLREASLAVRWA